MNRSHSPTPTGTPGKGMAIASMVLGIVALIPITGFGTVCAIVGLVLGVVGKKKLQEVGADTGMATAGIVMSIIALALSFLFLFVCSCGACLFI